MQFHAFGSFTVSELPELRFPPLRFADRSARVCPASTVKVHTK